MDRPVFMGILLKPQEPGNATEVGTFLGLGLGLQQ